LNILQVIPVFNPPELYGGSQQMVYQISKELVKRGHNVTVYASDLKTSNLKKRVNEATEKIDGVNIIHFRTVSPYLSEKTGLIVTPTMKKTLEQQGKNFDLIHVHEIRGYQQIIATQYAKRAKLPYIIQAHGILGIHRSLSGAVYDLVYGGRVLKGSHSSIALTEYEVEQYKLRGVPKNKIQIIPNGINLSEYSNLPSKGCFKKKFGIPESEKIVLYLGRIHKIKGIDVLVRAFANVAKSGGIKLVIVGSDDGYLRELTALIKTLGIDNKTILTGPLHGLEKLEAYVDANVYVLPSRYEAFSITLLEAYACGKTVIVSSCKGLGDLVIDDETGILVEPGNIFELNAAILLVLSGNTELGSKAKGFVKQFCIEKTVDQLEQLYSGVVGN
jgi:glycosyltransferase involved in cell wall biosynthesis